MSDCKTTLRNNLRRLRLACGYTQSNIARALGVSRSTYAHYESGMTVPGLETLAKLSGIFGVPLEQLVSPEEQPSPVPRGRRARHRPGDYPRAIGELTEGEKVFIARLRSGKN